MIRSYIIVALATMDFVLTSIGLTVFGIEYELNPLIVALWDASPIYYFDLFAVCMLVMMWGACRLRDANVRSYRVVMLFGIWLECIALVLHAKAFGVI